MKIPNERKGAFKKMENTIPVFLSIRETAKAGILTEYRLRCMEKAGELPCIYAGNKCLINIELLIAQLNDLQKGGAQK